jgi:arabinose-5-phosphate isomerase
VSANKPFDKEMVIELARSVLENEGLAVQDAKAWIGEDFVIAVQTLLECQGHVLVAGSGTSHAVALRLAHLLSCSGTPALFIHPGDSQHGSAGAVTNNDIVIAISKGGETSEVNALAKIAKKRGATIIGLTENRDSTLGNHCDLILTVKAPEDIDPFGMIATGSSLINSAIGDALCVVLLKMKDYLVEEFAETHPGGAIGKRIAGLEKNEE